VFGAILQRLLHKAVEHGQRVVDLNILTARIHRQHMPHQIRHANQIAELQTPLLQRGVARIAVARHQSEHHTRATHGALRHQLGERCRDIALGRTILIVAALQQVAENGDNGFHVCVGRQEIPIFPQRPRTHLNEPVGSVWLGQHSKITSAGVSAQLIVLEKTLQGLGFGV